MKKNNSISLKLPLTSTEWWSFDMPHCAASANVNDRYIVSHFTEANAIPAIYHTQFILDLTHNIQNINVYMYVYRQLQGIECRLPFLFLIND